MRSMNLKSYGDVFYNLDQARFNKYLEYFGVKVKPQEGQDIFEFVKKIVANNGLHSDQLDEFFIGYEIPQISKEFDLLRFGNNFTLDIELKHTSTPEKITKQLIQNKYYLKALGKPVKIYAYIVQTEEVFQLDEDDNLLLSNLSALKADIEIQDYLFIQDIDALFKPSVYLVSPLNSTEKFMAGSYFLNDNQLATKRDILKIVSSNTIPYVAIEGRPGTGKTLLTYDIAKELIALNWNVCLFHCGNLGQGHHDLRKSYSWNVHSIKSIEFALSRTPKYDLIIIDETQRIYSEHLERIIQYVSENNVKCIFSYDPDQVFTSKEARRDSAGKIEKLNHKKYLLTERIRTNKEIAAFIINLFDRNKIHPTMKYKNIHLQYFNYSDSLRFFLEKLKKNDYEVIDYTTSSYYLLSYDKYQVGDKNAHAVIGQEFDKVAVVINQNFYYDQDGKLISKREPGAPDYRLDKMLYQKLTRARQEIMIIIYKNESLLDACLKILGEKP